MYMCVSNLGALIPENCSQSENLQEVNRIFRRLQQLRQQ